MVAQVASVEGEMTVKPGHEVIEHGKMQIVGSSRLAEALLISKPDPWGSGYLRMYLCCGLIFLCSTMNG
jgi:hypothetical protein